MHQTRTVSRIATPDNEADLIEIAHRHPANRLGIELAAYLKGTEPDDEREQRHRQARFLKFWTDADGMTHGRFCLPPMMAATLIAMIEAIVMKWSRTVTDHHTESARNASADGSDDQNWPSLGQQRAIASSGRERCDVSARRAETRLVSEANGDDGTPVTDSTVASLIPDAFIRVLIHDAERNPINASGKQRHPTTRQKRVVKERDRVCVDCGSDELHEYDHQPAYEQTRHTIIDELKLRCAPCHKRRHRNEG